MSTFKLKDDEFHEEHEKKIMDIITSQPIEMDETIRNYMHGVSL